MDSKTSVVLDLNTQVGSGLEIDYTNWKNERRVRRVVPLEVTFGSNTWHKEDQFLMKALDTESGDVRYFAMKSIYACKQVSVL